MLSQDERRRFNEIAHHLTTDSRFLRQIRTSLPASPPSERPPKPWPTALCVLLAIVVPPLLAVRWWTAALVALAVLGTALTAVLIRRRH
jgi:hypothetical protein